jgi:FixJ family two-component response regulator/DNA-binding winged helix-turn-helix (wHTH) protein
MRDHASSATLRSREADSDRSAGLEFVRVAEPATAPAQRAISFGPFRLLPTQGLLLQASRRVHLGSRALEILLALVERPGELVSKAELMARAWPDTIVEECNLRVQVAGLRRALGDGHGGNRYLATIPGRGYRFVAPVTLTDGPAQSAPQQHVSLLESPPLEDRDPAPKDERPVVFVIDDDAAVREAVEDLLRSVDLAVRSFRSTQDFMRSERPDAPGCLVLDVRLPGPSGLEFQRELARSGIHLPIIFLTGHADVPMSVGAMKSGAIEFLTKPFREQELLDAIRLGIERDRAWRQDAAAVAELQKRFESLTARERNVMALVVTGASAWQSTE